MSLEFHLWPPEWLQSLREQADVLMASTDGRLLPSGIAELNASAIQLTGGDPEQAQDVLAAALSAPHFQAALLEASRPQELRKGPPPEAAAAGDTTSARRQEPQRQIRRPAAAGRRTAGQADARPSRHRPEILDVPQELALLAGSRSTALRAAVARNPSTPPDVLRHLAEDRDDRVVLGVAGNPSTPSMVLNWMTATSEPRVAIRSAARGNPASDFTLTPPDDSSWVLRLADEEPQPEPRTKKSAARSAREHAEWVSRLEHAEATPEVLTALHTHTSAHVRTAVAGNHATPTAVLLALAADLDGGVRSAVAGNPDTPTDVLRGMSINPLFLVSRDDRRIASSASASRFYAIDVSRSLGGNTATPADVLDALASHVDIDVCAAVAANPSTPPATLLRLATRKFTSDYRPSLISGSIKANVAGNPHTPSKALAGLTRAHDARVLLAVAANPSCPPPALDDLAGAAISAEGGPWNPQRRGITDRDWQTIQMALAANPSTPTKTVVRMAHGGRAEVQAAVVSNPSVTGPALSAVRHGITTSAVEPTP